MPSERRTRSSNCQPARLARGRLSQDPCKAITRNRPFAGHRAASSREICRAAPAGSRAFGAEEQAGVRPRSRPQQTSPARQFDVKHRRLLCDVVPQECRRL